MKLTNPTGTKKIIVDNHETLKLYLEDFTPGKRTFELSVELRGEKAQCDIQGRIKTTNAENKTWKIHQIFTGKKQTGTIDLRGIAEGKSQISFDGSAVVEPPSTKANITISERILLFDEGRGKLLPLLTVKTNNVKKASHSASIAPVDPQKILYLQSRGYKKKEAEHVVKEGFLKLTK